MLHGKNFVHAFEAEAALAVEEVRDVGLLESGLLGEVEAGEFSGFDALPQDLAKVVLQDFELHGAEYSTEIWPWREGEKISTGQVWPFNLD
jgi:hypothetical protein